MKNLRWQSYRWRHENEGTKIVLSWVLILVHNINLKTFDFPDHVIVRQKSGKLTVINENELKGNCRKTLESLEFPPESQMYAHTSFSFLFI